MAIEIFKHITIGELLSIQATRYANQPFLIHATDQGNQRLSYSEVEFQANALAAGLRELGLQPGDRLGLILPNVPAFVITLFAAAKAGLILVPVNVRRDRHGVLACLKNTLPKALVVFSDPGQFGGVDHLAMTREFLPRLSGLEHLIVWKNPTMATLSNSQETVLWDDLLAFKDALLAPSLSPESPAAIIHTVGSSGEIRGALLTQSGMVRNAAAVAATLHCSLEDIFLGALPFSNTFGFTATILACATAGAQLVCLPKYHPNEALRAIETLKVTVHHGVPTMFAMELNHPSFDRQRCASLRTGVMAGAFCPPELLKRGRTEMGCNVMVGYGLSEASPGVTLTRLEDGPVTASETVGHPLEGVALKVVDQAGNTLSAGESGELCVQGYNVMLRYWENPTATAQMLDSEGWLHTGDLAIIDQDGPVRIIGRKDDVINRAGFKVYPTTIEMVLRAFLGVKEIAVVGVPDLIYGELPCAWVVRQPGAEFTAEDLLSYAAQHLPGYAIPDRVVFFDALPRTPDGLLSKGYLRDRVRIRGHAWKFSKNIDTDAIIPARHCNTADPRELALHCMEDADPSFVKRMRRGDIIVADTNFGCGSSREVAPLTIKAAGVSAVIAKSFARIFFRNAINIGLPILECTPAVDGIDSGDEVEIEPTTGTIHNLTSGALYQAEPFPDFLQRIIDRGGLMAYVEDRLAKEAHYPS